MLGTIIAIYVAAGLAYWFIQAVGQTPTIFKWVIFILALPVLFPVALIKSLPEYLRKDGKWYKWRWLVYLNFALFILIIVIAVLPATPPKPIPPSSPDAPTLHQASLPDSCGAQPGQGCQP